MSPRLRNITPRNEGFYEGRNRPPARLNNQSEGPSRQRLWNADHVLHSPAQPHFGLASQVSLLEL